MAGLFKSLFEPFLKQPVIAGLIDYDVKEKEYRKREQERHEEKMSTLDDIKNELRM